MVWISCSLSFAFDLLRHFSNETRRTASLNYLTFLKPLFEALHIETLHFHVRLWYMIFQPNIVQWSANSLELTLSPGIIFNVSNREICFHRSSIRQTLHCTGEGESLQQNVQPWRAIPANQITAKEQGKVEVKKDIDYEKGKLKQPRTERRIQLLHALVGYLF